MECGCERKKKREERGEKHIRTDRAVDDMSKRHMLSLFKSPRTKKQKLDCATFNSILKNKIEFENI